MWKPLQWQDKVHKTTQMILEKNSKKKEPLFEKLIVTLSPGSNCWKDSSSIAFSGSFVPESKMNSSL